MFIKKYKNGEIIEYSLIAKGQTKNNNYHFEFIEALAPCFLDANHRQISLNQFDIVISQYFKNIKIKSKSEEKCIRHIGINLKYPTPLNQYLVANNPLIHDFMNDTGNNLKYVVFTNLNKQICHNYLNLLEIFCDDSSQPYIAFQAQRVTGLLLTELLRDHRSKISKNQSAFPSAKVKYASKYTQSGSIMAYISTKNGNVTLDEVANHFGYHRNYLSRLCHKLFNTDFIHLRLNIRMNLACEQLTLTTKSIEEISSELGYKDLSTFTKQFLDYYHVSPSLYRKKNAVY
ncbi:helix-turn-helix domain-containing protein [Lactobacillus agrestimuris]|uniref:helix-turn-helix domain-containing protein n=1 Tax=Lactobacillus agrestimuris TaxID=2941328 RepID=UPI002043C176|nr:helix-turn-helix transcriptional regulator [Lactobacillus agrestimuris]